MLLNENKTNKDLVNLRIAFLVYFPDIVKVNGYDGCVINYFPFISDFRFSFGVKQPLHCLQVILSCKTSSMFFLMLASVVETLATDSNCSRSIYSFKSQVENNSLFSEILKEELVKLSVDRSLQIIFMIDFYVIFGI